MESELITDAKHGDDWGVLLFVLAMLLMGVGGWRGVREWEEEGG